MIVSIGSDHRGLEQRKLFAEAIKAAGHTVDDCGTHSTESCDYPDIAFKVANQVVSNASQLGILVCGTGIGMSIAANKVAGIRAAVCCSLESALLSRRHNDANILCLAGNAFDDAGFKDVVTQWHPAEFEGGRHASRRSRTESLALSSPSLVRHH